MGLILALLLVLQGPLGWTGVAKTASAQVLRLESLTDEEGEKGICSGVVISEVGFLLTAAHCIPHAAHSLTVSGRHAEAARVNRLLDLAVVRFARKTETAMPLAAASPAQGEEVGVVGFAFGEEKVVVQVGRVAQAFNEPLKSILIDARVLPGDSGGAIVNAKGELVGLTQATYGSLRGTLGVAAPVEALVEFVESYLPRGK